VLRITFYKLNLDMSIIARLSLPPPYDTSLYVAIVL